MFNIILPLILSLSSPDRKVIDTAPVMRNGVPSVQTAYSDGTVSVSGFAPCENCKAYVASLTVPAAGNTLKLTVVSDVGNPNNGANGEVSRRGSCAVVNDKCTYTGTTCRADAVWEFTVTDAAGNRVDATITILGPGINLVDIDGRITHRALVDAACGVGGSVLVTVLAFAPEGSGSWTVGLTSGCMPCDGSSIPM